MLNTLALLGSHEIILVIVLVLVLFGGTKIPQLMRGVGKGMGELQKGIDEGKRGLDKALYEDSNPDEQKPSSVR